MGTYEQAILPRLIDRLLSSPDLSRLRELTCRNLEGVVLEIGFGSGLNVPHLPQEVTRLLAVDPAVVGRKLAAPRISRRNLPVDFVGLDGSRIEIPDNSVDHVLCTMTLCTIPKVDDALREVHRVLRPGGSFAFLEHGLAPDENVARWQRRLTPLQRRIFGGCHLDRSSTALIATSGLRMESSHSAYERGPRIMSYFTRGVARKAERVDQ
jgi:ubiquinone/menaquinone biosynthesis C-methylase UbiE